MKLLHILNYLLLIACGAVLWACASVGAPTGGPKDIKPPAVRFSLPKDQSLNYRGKTVVIEFSEAIEVKNIQNNLLITPNTNNPFEYDLRKNVLTLKFEKEFEPNTTYVFDFGESVEDVTEHNKALNLKLAFSTGENIDSLYISGSVSDLLTNKPEVKAAVGIYRADDTLNVQEDKPLYYTRTDSMGYFRMNNLKEGEYKIYAIMEPKKSDLVYNSADEKIGFTNRSITLRLLSVPGVGLKTVRYDIKPIAITSARPKKQYFEVKANKKLTDFSVEFEDTTYRALIPAIIDNDVVRFYNNTGKPATDSIRATITLVDSVQQKLTSPIMVKFDEARDAKGHAFAPSEVPQSGTTLIPGQPFTLAITFNKPIRTFVSDSIAYTVDKDTVEKRVSSRALAWNPTYTRATIDFSQFKFKEKISINLKKAAFISIENDSSKQRPLMYMVKDPAQFGTISGIVRTKHKSFILQLLNEKGVVEQELKNSPTFRFSYAVPGKKRLRVLLDTDGDGTWETGDLKQGIPPEPIFFFSEELSLKPNWDIEDLIVDVDEEQDTDK